MIKEHKPIDCPTYVEVTEADFKKKIKPYEKEFKFAWPFEDEDYNRENCILNNEKADMYWSDDCWSSGFRIDGDLFPAFLIMDIKYFIHSNILEVETNAR
jgi:hypothetical protein